MLTPQTPISKIIKILTDSPGTVPSFLVSASESTISGLSLDRPIEILHKQEISGRKIEDFFFSVDYENASECLKKLPGFLATNPLYLKRKIIWWTIKDDFNPSIQNKLLKTIEEAGNTFSFVFCKHLARMLLPTVESRLIAVRLRAEVPSSVGILPALSNSSFLDFQKKWDENQWTEKYVLAQLVERMTQSKQSNFASLEKLCQFLEWFNKSSQWNNPLVERKYMLFQYVRLLT